MYGTVPLGAVSMHGTVPLGAVSMNGTVPLGAVSRRTSCPGCRDRRYSLSRPTHPINLLPEKLSV